MMRPFTASTISGSGSMVERPLSPLRAAHPERLRSLAAERKVTLHYVARDERHDNAAVITGLLE